MSEGPIHYEAGWGVVKISSSITTTKFNEPREKYRILNSIELLLRKAYKRACYQRLGSMAVNEYLFKASTCISLYSFFNTVLRSYILAPT